MPRQLGSTEVTTRSAAGMNGAPIPAAAQTAMQVGMSVRWVRKHSVLSQDPGRHFRSEARGNVHKVYRFCKKARSQQNNPVPADQCPVGSGSTEVTTRSAARMVRLAVFYWASDQRSAISGKCMLSKVWYPSLTVQNRSRMPTCVAVSADVGETVRRTVERASFMKDARQ